MPYEEAIPELHTGECSPYGCGGDDFGVEQAMTEESIKKAKWECKRFMEYLEDLDSALAGDKKSRGDPRTYRDRKILEDERIYLSDCPIETGALRRSSLDLTRALSKMRRSAQ